MMRIRNTSSVDSINKRKPTWANCGCLAIAALALVFLGIAILYFMVGPGIGGFGADEEYKAIQRGDRTPQWSADGQILVMNLGDEIYGASVDGNRLWRIAHKDTEHHLSGVFYPSLSANGEVAYLKYHYDDGIFKRADPHKYHIGLTDIDGTEPNRLLNEIEGGSFPEWSPNGSRLAFAKNGQQAIIMTKREPGQLFPWARLSSNLTFWRKYDTLSIPGKTWRTFWSNDNQRIASIEQSREQSLSRIVNMQWDGADQKITMEQNSSIGEFEPTSLAWSTTDDRIYFVYYEKMDEESSGFTPSVRSVRPDGSDERIIALLWEDFRIRGLKLSPDGSQLLFTAHRTLGDRHSISLFLMKTDGSEVIKVYDPQGVQWFRTVYASWSPDGSRIAIHDLLNGGNIFTISPDGADARLVIGPGVQPGYGKPLQENE